MTIKDQIDFYLEQYKELQKIPTASAVDRLKPLVLANQLLHLEMEKSMNLKSKKDG